MDSSPNCWYICRPSQDIRWDLGEPAQTEIEPDGELVWIYEFPGVEWEFAWSGDQALESVEMRLPGGG